MPKFAFTAVDSTGRQQTGVLEAEDPNSVAVHLRDQGLFPTRIEETRAGAKVGVKDAAKSNQITLFQSKSVNSKKLTIFTRQLATLIDAGLPLLRGLSTLERQERNPALKNATLKMAESVEGGSTFSEAMSQHPKIFNKLYVNMVKAGELGGVLEIVLKRLAEFMEKAQKIKGKVVSAMVYPAVVLFIAVLILAFLLVFIVPKFKQIFADMLQGEPLPPLTEFVIGASEIALRQWYWVVAAIVVLVVTYKLLARTPKGAAFTDRVKLNTPVVGDLIRKTAIARFSRTLGTLVTSGVPILQALNITKETAGNVVVADAIGKVHDAVKEGESVVHPLESSGVFPPMVISMVDIGEETGRLPDMLMKVADVYDEEVDNAVAGLTSLLEPAMIVFLAVVVGTIVIALFLPLMTIIEKMSQTT
jgi:type IV pilus assembly protein PilC